MVLALIATAIVACEPSASATGAQAAAGSPFAIGDELPTAADIAAAVAASVNVPTWPVAPALGKQPWNVDACVGGKDAQTASRFCVYGDPKGKRVMVMFGDSHAGMWGPALGIIGKHLGWRVEQLTLRSCPAEDFPVYSYELKGHYAACDEHRAASFAKIEELHPDIVFISSQYRGILAEKDNRPDAGGNDASWAAGLNATLAHLTKLASRTVYLGDIGYSEQQPVDCLSSNPDDVRRCNTDRKYAVLAAHNEATRKAVEDAGYTYIDPIPWQCASFVCPAVVGGMPVWKDRAHLTAGYVLWLRGVLDDAVRFRAQ